MIKTTTLYKIVNTYIDDCNEHNKAPTYNGLGDALGITGQTIRHIVKGAYKDGKPYTKKPHISRCIDNEDFKIIQDVYI